MKASFYPCRGRSSDSAGGSTLVIAMLTVTVISFIAANTLLSISSRYNSAYRSASWNEALVTAEAGINAVSADIAHLVPNVVPGVNSLGNGYSQPSLGLINTSNLNNLQISPAGVVTVANAQVNPVGGITNGNLLSIQALSLHHGGEGSTEQQATVSVDTISLSKLLNPNDGAPITLSSAMNTALGSINNLSNGNGINLLHLVSTGTVYLSGGHVAGPSRQDNDLWRVSLFNNSGTHAAVDKPQVSRQIEVYLRPVYTFDSAVASNDSLQAANKLSLFDSFNSALPTASTGGQYDSLKRGSNATLRANGAAVTLGGKVYGNVNTNGGSVPQDSHVTGKVNNASYCPLPVVTAPTWNGDSSAPSSITGTTVLSAGTALKPAQYRFNKITGSLHITGGLLGTGINVGLGTNIALGTNVEIFVDGDVTGSIEIDPNITAKLYVSGSITANASQLKNDTGVAANLQVYGVPSSTGGTPQISINLDTAFCASIYAPLHGISFSGSGDVSGAAVGATFRATDALRFHYDESLAYSAGSLVRYQAASWREIPIPAN